MLKLEIIGNLGADAECRVANGSEYIAFRVADSRKIANDQSGGVVESTTWVSCTMDGRRERLLPFLRKGVKVFCRGNIELKIFKSPKDGLPKVGINLYVTELQLCGSEKRDEDKPY